MRLNLIKQGDEILNQALILANCPSCGAVFRSRAFAISGNVSGLTLRGNKETCPFCGAWANISDGLFDVANGVLRVISAPQLTKDMLAAFGALIQKAHEQKTAPDELAKEADEIDPELGKFIRLLRTRDLYAVGLLLLLIAIRSCTVSVEVDVNELIDQINDVPPTEIVKALGNQGK